MASSWPSQELAEWNARYKRRCSNRPIVEIEIAAAGQMKVTELRLANLFSTKAKATSTGEDRVSTIGAHITADSEAVAGKPSRVPAQTRPPIATDVLDTAKGSPAAGIEVNLKCGRAFNPVH